MKPVQSDPYSAHQDVMLLLPWYVNHTLQGTELKRVEAHHNVCLMCKREILNLQKLTLVVNQSSALHTHEQVAFTQLKKRLHQSSPSIVQAATTDAIDLSKHKTAQRAAEMPWTLSRPALAMAAVLLLALAIPGYFKMNPMLSRDYRTLSEGSMANLHSNDSHLVFADNTTPEQIEQLLAPFAGQIIGKPTEQTLYTVRFEQINSKEALIVRLAQLKKNPRVIFAEPATTLLSATKVERPQK
jgi:hypothetical protein